MNPKLQKLFDQLEVDRIELLSHVEKLTMEEFQKSVNGKWSIQQILSHLIIAERLSLQYLNKKVHGINEANNTGVLEELKMIALKLTQRLPFKFKAPKGLNEITPILNLDQLKFQWKKDRDELKTFLEKITDDQLKKKIYRHVRAGLLNIQHALIFYREHYIHHLPQIKKLMPRG
jgi:uncharacterized damage-inducible protein DinB